MSSDDAPVRDSDWGGWEGHERRERLARLQTTPAQRLAWLEAAIEFVASIGRLPDGGSVADDQQPPA